MKKIKKILLAIAVIVPMFFLVTDVNAASSISFSTSSPKKGKSLKITITTPKANTVDLTATISGAGVSDTIRLVDGDMSGSAKQFSASKTVTPASTGTITVTISSSSNAVLNGSYIDISGSESVDVTENATSNGGGSSSSSSNNNSSSSNNSSSNSSQTNTTTEDTRSKDNTLSSLSVSEGTLSPQFSSSKTKYDIDLSGTVTEVKISAKANDSKAKVSGTGTKSVKVGDTTFKVVCTAENGSTKTYTLTFHVDETPLVYTEYNDVSLGVVRILDDVKVPKNFEKGTTKLDGQEVDAFINKDLNLSLVYLTDDKGNEDFYIVSDEKVISKYQTLIVNGKTYVIVNAPDSLKGVEDLKSSTIKIGDIELSGWQFENEALSHYSLVYLMNDVGESGLYTYEDTEGTLQKYTPVEEEKDNTLTYVFIGTTAVFVVSTAVMGYLYLSFKKKSISAIKDYYERKNQG